MQAICEKAWSNCENQFNTICRSVYQFLGLDALAHGGKWLGFRTYILRFPDQHFTVVVLANLAQLNVAEIASKISKIYLADKLTFPVAITLAPEVMRNYVGKYEIQPGLILEVTLEKNTLWSKIRQKVKLLPESETRFFAEGAEERGLTFHKDERGNVVSVSGRESVTARKLR